MRKKFTQKECFCLLRWNETVYDGSPVSHDDVLGVLRKYIFFSEDAHVFSNVSGAEEHIFGGSARAIPPLLKEVMHKCEDMILVCIWQGKYMPCATLFSVRRTDNGFCCSFNTVRQSEQL